MNWLPLKLCLVAVVLFGPHSVAVNAEQQYNGNFEEELVPAEQSIGTNYLMPSTVEQRLLKPIYIPNLSTNIEPNTRFPRFTHGALKAPIWGQPLHTQASLDSDNMLLALNYDIYNFGDLTEPAESTEPAELAGKTLKRFTRDTGWWDYLVTKAKWLSGTFADAVLGKICDIAKNKIWEFANTPYVTVVDDAVDKPAVMPVDMPAVMPVDMPAIMPVDMSAVMPVDMPVDMPAVMPVDMPAVMPVDMSAVMPVDMPAVMPVDMSAVMPVDIPAVMPVDMPAVMPAEIQDVLVAPEPESPHVPESPKELVTSPKFHPRPLVLLRRPTPRYLSMSTCIDGQTCSEMRY